MNASATRPSFNPRFSRCRLEFIDSWTACRMTKKSLNRLLIRNFASSRNPRATLSLSPDRIFGGRNPSVCVLLPGIT